MLACTVWSFLVRYVWAGFFVKWRPHRCSIGLSSQFLVLGTDKSHMVPDQVSMGAGVVRKLCFWPDNCEPSGPCVLERYRGADNNPQMTIILLRLIASWRWMSTSLYTCWLTVWPFGMYSWCTTSLISKNTIKLLSPGTETAVPS